MKQLFLFALLGNIVFFLWQYYQGAAGDNQPQANRVETGKNQIILVSELKQNTDPEITGLNNRENIEVLAEQPNFTNIENKKGLAQLAVDVNAVNESEKMQMEIEQLQQPVRDTKFNKQQTNDAGDLTEVDASKPAAHEAAILRAQDDDQQITVKGPIIYEAHVIVYAQLRNLHSLDGRAVTQSQQQPSDQTDIDMASNPNSIKEYCFEAGPYEDGSYNLQEWMKQSDIKFTALNYLTKDVEIINDYLVFFPAAETAAQAQTNVTLLKEHGVTDLWLFREGDMRWAVSLGLFSQQSRANTMQNDFKKQGLDVQVMPRMKTKQQVFAKLRLKLNQPEKDKVKDLFMHSFPDVQFKHKPACWDR